jgi:putative nucleotidyltransferase with HDIG domain
LLSIARNISERKQSEESLYRANRALKLLGMCNTALIRAEDEQTFLSEICRLAVETGGYLMAWVGFAEDDAAKTVRPVAQAGDRERYLDSIKITWADSELGRGPTGTAIRTGLTVINQDYISNLQTAPWREAALEQGYHASISLPLTSKKRILGALSIYAKDSSAFGEEEVALLEKLANDLAYGIETLRTRAEHQQHTVILQQGLEQSIQIIANTVAVRDPYTADHQLRVSDLARAIAQQMGLPEEQVHGIHLAATIHDLGKIQIPAEILSKSGKLNDVEYMLIQAHPQAGYDILKNVQFPWPIADIILQHHERLDGSGYPKGLKGDDILLESKIIAVADVVEAMSSHRPYRTGLGLDITLQEIERNRGKLYEAKAVDACLKLFREDGYTLPRR